MAQALPAEIAADPKFSTPPPPPAPRDESSFWSTVKTFPRSFWVGCTMEMWERLAFYGTRVVLPIYIAQADEPGGLHFTPAQKGSIYAWWAIVQSGVPMISGGFADRYGYKKTIALSATINVMAFVLMANLRSYDGFFSACLLLGLGTALFKPGLQGTLAQSMGRTNASVGWGLFYWLVNVGAAIGPPFAGFMHLMGWKFVFYGCAAITSLNFLMLLTYAPVESGADTSRGPLKVARDTLVNFFEPRLLLLVAIFSGFWMMLWQLSDFMPNFYADWVDSSDLVARMSWLPRAWLQESSRGLQLRQENALNLNAVVIVLLVVPTSFLASRMRVLTSISIGVLVATLGTLVYGTSPSIYTVLLGIFLFSVGEMLTGPKKTEYFSLIAPKGKKALYLGYVNIPVAIGQSIGAKIAGWQYGKGGEKATLALRYLAEKTEFVKGKGAWDGDVDHLASYCGISRTAAVETLAKVLGTDGRGVNQLLWDTYQPYRIWFIFGAVGFLSLVGMVVFGQLSKRWNDMNV